MFGLAKRSKSGTAKRREGLRRNIPTAMSDIRAAVGRPEVGNCLFVGAVSTLVVALLMLWSMATPKVSEGQVAVENRLVRQAYEVEDEAATRDKRDEAARGAPRIYQPNQEYLSRIRVGLERLPEAVAGRSGIDGIDEALVQEFDLTDEKIRRLQEFAPAVVDGAAAGINERWKALVGRYLDSLVLHPILDPQDQQVFLTTKSKEVMPPPGPDGAATPLQGDALATDASERMVGSWLMLRAEEAGAKEAIAEVLVAPVLRSLKPTLIFDPAETARRAASAAEAVQPVKRMHPRGEVVYLRGDKLTPAQVKLTVEEAGHYLASVAPVHRWLIVAGITAFSALIVTLLAAYLLIFYPAICRKSLRLSAIFALIVGFSALALVAAIEAPWLQIFVASGTCLVAAMVLTLAYDRRLALFVSAVHCLLVTLLLDAGTAFFVALLCGCAAMIVQLREVRHRTALIRASAVTAAVMGVAMGLAAFIRLPSLAGADAVFSAAAWAAFAGIATGFLMLGILPTIERMFDITTGLTLAELRDPKQPLLRQLQQKAPGTYNHSLQIANIAEAAAEAIGADGLLVYVGGLYHDIGKLNKPEYFVENQVGGVNKHEKLSPTMSLLIILGHVKDGIELAREYGLPRSIRHFIESHHGTTLVEYFYQAARSRAEASGEGEESVAEVAYRYPGPRPRTKEAAILMIADAVESATRAMTEPNPSRIETLVRTLSRKRLEDGQFDESDLTLRELTRIEESIIKSLCAIYHGRISYPAGASGPKTEAGTTTARAMSLTAP